MNTATARRQEGVAVTVREAAIALMKAADSARNEMVRVLEPYDVTLQQVNVLVILQQANGQGVPTLDVAAQLVERTPGITRLVNSLSRKRYVRRTRPKTDRRQQLCYLTDSGARLLAQLLPVFLSSQARIFRSLNQDERADFVELLRRVTDPQTQTRRMLS
ncbi:MAG: hypothetical protein WBD07_10825 [Vicinamibacterales bacterium]